MGCSDAYDEMAKQEDIDPCNVKFNRRDVRGFTKWSDYQIKTHLKQLEELEYIYAVHGKKGKRYSYQLLWDGQGVDGHKFLMGLIEVEKIRDHQRGYQVTQ